MRYSAPRRHSTVIKFVLSSNCLMKTKRITRKTECNTSA